MPPETKPLKDMSDEEFLKHTSENAATAVIDRIGPKLGIDPAKLKDDAVDNLLKEAGFITKEEVQAAVLDSLKMDDTRKLIGGMAPFRGKEHKGPSEPPFSFIDFLGTVASSDVRTSLAVGLKRNASMANPEVTADSIIEFVKSSLTGDQLKAFDMSSGAVGAFLVPEYYADSLIDYRQPSAPAIGRGTSIPMGDKRTIHFPRITALCTPDIYWEGYVPRSAKTPTDTPEFERPDLTLQLYYVLWQITHDLLKFNNVGLDGLMRGWVAGAIQRELDRLMLVGDVGAGDAYDGILNTAGVTNLPLLVPGTLSFDDLINLEFLLPAEYWTGATYVMNQSALREVSFLKDTTGNYIWHRDPTGKTPGTIHGYPFILDNQIGNAIGGANQSVIFFGVLSYWFQGNGGMKFSVSDHVGFKENQTWYKVVGYADGFYALPVAMNYLEAVPV